MLFNTVEGCKRKGNCLYSNEVIGEDASKAVLQYSKNKQGQIKAGNTSSSKGKSKGKGKETKGDGNGSGRARAQADTLCWHFHTQTPGQCKYGDLCRFKHK